MKPNIINHIHQMEVFICIVEHGNFSTAARQLMMVPSSISKLIARLEKHLNTKLFNRTTRKLVLTEAGEFYYHRAIRLMADVKETEAIITSRQNKPRGKVRITCSVPFAFHQVIPLLPLLNATHPQIEIILLSTDAVVDLLKERCDIAIRIGPLRDSTLKVRRLADSKLYVVAAPQYLKKYGKPSSPHDLLHHNCLNFYANAGLNQWVFKPRVLAKNWCAQGSLSADNGESIRLMALAGGGIARLSAFMVNEDIKSKRLIPLLMEWDANEWQPVYLLHTGNISARVKVVIDYLYSHMARRFE